MTDKQIMGCLLSAISKLEKTRHSGDMLRIKFNLYMIKSILIEIAEAIIERHKDEIKKGE